MKMRWATLGFLLAGCSSGGFSGDDGGPGGGDGGNPITRTQCGLAPCGGNLVGRWQVATWCGKGIGFLPCNSPYHEDRVAETGVVTFAADLTYTFSLMQTGTEEFTLPNSCSSVAGTDCNQRCGNAAGGSTGTPTPDQASCICGYPRQYSYTGGDSYSVTGSGGLVFGKANPSTAQYCVQGNMLVISGQDENPLTAIYTRM